MSKSMNMLRTRRRDNNVKPNRRLDRRSSRGMIYENEELRLKTININAEIERGQSDIKKLRRENEMLKKEIWYLRDEYEKLDKLLKQKEADFTSSPSTCSSDSEASACEDPKQVEASQNLANVQITNLQNLRAEFDHLSVVPEEPSGTENSAHDADEAEAAGGCGGGGGGILQPDQGYPGFPMTKHFFAPLPSRPMTPPPAPHLYSFRSETSRSGGGGQKRVDLVVKTDNAHFEPGGAQLDAMQALEAECSLAKSSFSFSNGGNLDELLNDIQTISEDILKISNPGAREATPGKECDQYKSELSVVLMPTPMPLLGFEKYQNLSADKLNHSAACASPENWELSNSSDRLPGEDGGGGDDDGGGGDEHKAQRQDEAQLEPAKKDGIRRKVSIHFKGRRDGDRSAARQEEDATASGARQLRPPALTTPSAASEEATSGGCTPHPNSSDSEHPASPATERHDAAGAGDGAGKKQHKHQKRKKGGVGALAKARRSAVGTDRLQRERSASVCTDRGPCADEYLPSSERERTNSLSSCGTHAERSRRKFSTVSSRIPSGAGGKIPWCACWGNGCI